MPKESTCEVCVHFQRHYVKVGDDYFYPISCGHCVYPRIKSRECDYPACKYFAVRKN